MKRHRKIELELPPRDLSPFLHLLYGIDKKIAKLGGLSQVPKNINGHWIHGWHPAYKQSYKSNLLFIGIESPECNPSLWVARRDEEVYLKGLGYKKARAIGSPICYFRDDWEKVERIPGSLIVFPAHSLEWTKHDWKEQEYVDQILEVAGDFESVHVCVHADCFKSGYWVNAFKNAGLPVIEGATIRDRNTLSRISYLLKRFEYVTTNSFGSVIPYAALMGAKPSVYGTYADYKKEDYSKDPILSKNKEVLDDLMDSVSGAVLRQNYPNLFVDPISARNMISWGEQELGFDCMLPINDLVQLFGWSTFGRLKDKAKKILKTKMPFLRVLKRN